MCTGVIVSASTPHVLTHTCTDNKSLETNTTETGTLESPLLSVTLCTPESEENTILGKGGGGEGDGVIG